MYSTCLHCQRSLGSNDLLESLPIGRRIAFDAKQGRLWIVCRACERWNLSPLEERWEAVEQCERAFRATRVRVSTDNIGLARLRDDTELVRVGSPLRPEFAAWRYGDQFGRRRIRSAITAVGITAGVGAAVGIAASAGAGVVSVLSAVALLPIGPLIAGILTLTARATGPRIELPDLSIAFALGTPRLIAMDIAEGWGLELGCVPVGSAIAPPRFKPAWFETPQYHLSDVVRVKLPASQALTFLRHILPRVNRAGAARSVIADGVQLIEDAGGPENFGRWAVSKRHEWDSLQTYGDSGDLEYIPAPARLAFEMALHEDSEYRALHGELAILERAWRDAEGVASIADNLLVPELVQQQLDAMHRASDRDPL